MRSVNILAALTKQFLNIVETSILLVIVLTSQLILIPVNKLLLTTLKFLLIPISKHLLTTFKFLLVLIRRYLQVIAAYSQLLLIPIRKCILIIAHHHLMFAVNKQLRTHLKFLLIPVSEHLHKFHVIFHVILPLSDINNIIHVCILNIPLLTIALSNHHIFIALIKQLLPLFIT